MPLDLAGYREAERRIRAAAERGDTRLNLRYLRAGAIPPSLAALKYLRELDLAANDLVEIPDFLADLRNLEALNLALNGLRDLPAALGGLSNLKALDLARNRYPAVPSAVLRLGGLAVLNVEHNRIEELPARLADLRMLEALPLAGNPALVDPSPEIVAGGLPAILGYLRGKAARAPKIFLSHAGPDLDRVMALYDQLRESGFEPWIAAKNILAGEQWQEVILETIHGVDFFLLCHSENVAGCRPVLELEISTALARQRREFPAGIFFVPALLTNCALPASIAGLHAVQLFRPEGYSHLVASLNKGMARRQGAQRSDPPTAPDSPR